MIPRWVLVHYHICGRHDWDFVSDKPNIYEIKNEKKMYHGFTMTGKSPRLPVTENKATNIILEIKVSFNTWRPRKHGRHFADDTFKRISLKGNFGISIKLSLRFVRKCSFDTIPALVYIMAWRRSGDKSLSEPVVVRLPTHIFVTRPQWVSRAMSTHRNEAFFGTLSKIY